jgi:flavorubredoxin
MPVVKLTDSIYWVGIVDWNVRDFHGYETTSGSTYNAYLIMDEKIALVDVVKGSFAEQFRKQIEKVVDPKKIDYIISNHSEPDHSGSLGDVLSWAPQATVIATAKGKATLKNYHPGDWNAIVPKVGEPLSLGKHTLDFIPTPMLHWPDSMFTYVREEKLLFSMDAFGQHLATAGRFDTDVPLGLIMTEAKRYYANIIMHLGRIVKKTLEAAKDLAIETIAPSHGVIWRKHIPEILAAYRDWADCVAKNRKVLVIYESMWSSTEQMAEAIYNGALDAGAEAKLLSLKANNLTDLVTEVLDAQAFAVGTPTLNNGPMPTVAAFVNYITGLKPTHKIGMTFGAHGWAGGGAERVATELQAADIELPMSPITCSYRPSEDVLRQCYEAGKALAETKPTK